MNTYKVSVITGEKTFENRELELKNPQAGQVLVKVDSVAICTLEQRIYNGVMKNYPFAGGHEVAGIVQEVGDGVKNVKQGDKVSIRLLTNCGECYYCRSGNENQCVISFKASIHDGINGPGGIAQYMTVSSKTVYKLDDDMDLAHASLCEPLACCVHSMSMGNVNLADDVVVIGVGIMGALHIQLAKLRGARVIACEIDEKRLEVAKQMGADVLVNSKETNAVEKIKELTQNRGADVVFCTAAHVDLAAQAVAMTGKLGKCVLYSSFHPKKPIDLDVNAVHYSEMIITGSVNPMIKDFLVATKLLSSKLVNVEPVISEVVPFDKLEHAFEMASKPDTYRIIVKMP